MNEREMGKRGEAAPPVRIRDHGLSGTGRAAFFDVDETLITAKSMFEFLRFWLARTGDDGTMYRREAGALHAMSVGGVPRAQVNRAYYQRYAGAPWIQLLTAGRDWYAGYRQRPDAFVPAGLDALARHRAAGDAVVLVSGSFQPCLAPIAADLGADRVLCTQVMVGADGRLTGEVVAPMIGAAKAAAVIQTIAELGVAGGNCHGYADHASDLDMLRAVGHPVVIGDDPELCATARDRGWPVLSPAGSGGSAGVAGVFGSAGAAGVFGSAGVAGVGGGER